MNVKDALRAIAPFGLVKYRHDKARERFAQASHHEWQSARRLRLAEFAALSQQPGVQAEEHAFSWDDAVKFLVEEHGLPRHHVQEGSVPAASVTFVEAALAERLPSDRPVFGLHVGNFVGVSLCAMANAARRIHPRSVVVALDPNISHRGVDAPHRYVCRLARRYGLLSHVLPIASFSRHRNMRDDGVEFSGPTIDQQKETDIAFDDALTLLTSLTGERFDFVFLDGNHDAAYLREEINFVRNLLRPGGLLILDDVDDVWPDIRKVYHDLADAGWADVGTNGRVGILQVNLKHAGAEQRS